jgi:predicted permease
MGFAFVALSPIFLTIGLGVLLGRSGMIGDEHWKGVDQLAYYVLFPAIIIKSIATADFAGLPVFRMLAVMVCGMVSIQVLMFMARTPMEKGLAIDTPAWTSVFQGAGRWHTFIGLAIMPALFGLPGLALAAVAAAAITPTSNIASVIVLSICRSGTWPGFGAVIKMLVTNPFILAIIAGVGVQMSPLPLPHAVGKMLELIGDGALGVALLSVGAALRFGHVVKDFKPISAAVVLKMAVVPLFMAFYCWLFGVDGLPRTVAILAGSVPTAAVSFIFARKMGGDAVLMANIITIQIIIAAFSLPLVLYLVG